MCLAVGKFTSTTHISRVNVLTFQISTVLKCAECTEIPAQTPREEGELVVVIWGGGGG